MLISQAASSPNELAYTLPIVFILTLLLIGLVVLIGIVLTTLVIKNKFGGKAALGFVLAIFMVPTAMALVLFALFTKRSVQDSSSAQAVIIQREKSVDWGDAVTTNRRTADLRALTSEAHPGVRAGYAVPIRVEAQPNAPAAAWSVTDMDEFQASLYPGLLDCAAPLAREVSDVIESDAFTFEGEDPKYDDGQLTFVACAWDSLDDHRNGFLSSFVESLQRVFPNAEVLSRSDSNAALNEDDYPKGAFLLTLSGRIGSKIPAPWSNHDTEKHGTVKCRIQNSGSSAETQMNFISKPWVMGFDQLVSEQPDRQFLVGYSDKLASSEPEARQLAMKNAQAQVRIAAGNGVNTLIDESSVVDRFAQKLSRPYGDVWREAILVDITGDAIRGNAAIAVARANRSSTRGKATAMTTVLLLLTTVAICFIANLLTQGYYRRSIKISGVGVTVAVIIFIVGLVNLL